MDKRWIYIIIILILGISAMYVVVSSSHTIGSAIVDVNKFVITLPDEFNIDDSDKNSASLIDRANDTRMIVKDFGKGNSIDKRLQKDLDEYYNGDYGEVINKTTTYNDIKITTFYCLDEDDNVDSTSYFIKFNHTFNIKTDDFHSVDSVDSNVRFIIDTLQRDYKQSQD